MPVGDWIWPGIWLRPIHNEYGIWPASGEIDIVESRGNLPSNPSGGMSISSLLVRLENSAIVIINEPH